VGLSHDVSHLRLRGMVGTENGPDSRVMVRDSAMQPNRDSISPLTKLSSAARLAAGYSSLWQLRDLVAGAASPWRWTRLLPGRGGPMGSSIRPTCRRSRPPGSPTTTGCLMDV